jgi:TatD DNase family protein
MNPHPSDPRHESLPPDVPTAPAAAAMLGIRPRAAAEMIDIGANLADASFDGDRVAVIARARRAGVAQMIVTGSSVASTAGSIRLARSHPKILFGTAGMHPHHASALDDAAMTALAESARDETVVAVGEMGLDYFRDLSPRDVQARAFEAQLELAAAVGKPVFLHERDAAVDFLAIVGRWRGDLVGGVVHCFTGSAEFLDALLDLDFHIGITGWVCDERRGGPLAAIVDRIPQDRLLIETDAPYLLPRTLSPRPKTRRNEPCWLHAVRDRLAELRREDSIELATATARNARRLFGLPEPPESPSLAPLSTS